LNVNHKSGTSLQLVVSAEHAEQNTAGDAMQRSVRSDVIGVCYVDILDLVNHVGESIEVDLQTPVPEAGYEDPRPAGVLQLQVINTSFYFPKNVLVNVP
jgi:hypothetical protein